jgi:hypothetical protein
MSRFDCRRHRAGFAAAVTVLLAAGLAALPAAAAASGGRSKLRPTAVTSPAWADPTQALPAAVTVANRGTATSSKTVLRLYLSKDKKLSKGDAQLAGSPAVPALRAGRKATVLPTLRLPTSARPGQFWLLACVTGHCAPSGHRVRVTATPKTSGDLIAAAVAAHKISAGTALVDNVYTALGDPRLPAAYRGDDPPLFDDMALNIASDEWSTLSSQQRALLTPMLQGPSGPHGYGTTAAKPQRTVATDGCAHTGPTGMKFVDSPNGKIRIWYPTKGVPQVAAAAGTLARQAQRIWQDYAALMGREPPSDAGFCGFNGGDGHYDVYLVDNDLNGFVRGYAVTVNYKGFHQTGGPAFTVFNCWADDPPDGWQLAHELFHAFQFAYAHADELNNYAGFDEGAANWAANREYPKADWEHSDDEMITWGDSKSDTFPNNGFGYELWLFDYFLTQRYGENLIPQMYDQFQHEDELTAMNSVMPGGFADRMPEFTRYAWNQTPVTDGFRAWDRVPEVPWAAYEQPLQPMNLHLGDLESRTLNLPDKLEPLTHTYLPLHVDDSHIHDLLFTNTAEGTQGASVQAFVKLKDGTWKTQDWTNRKTVEFCRDEGPDQNVTDLVIMYANGRYQDKGALSLAKQPTLQLRNNCDRYYRVTSVTGTYHETISVADTSHSYTCTDSGTEDFSLTVHPSAAGTTDGSYSPHGIGFVTVPASLSGSRHYHQDTCSGGQPFLQPCDATLSQQPDYLIGIGDFNDSSPVPVQISNLRHQDPYDEACDTEYKFDPNGDNPSYMDPTSVSRAALEGTAPFTISASNTYDDNAGRTYSTSLTLTLQPTDEAGDPLQ